MALEVIKPFLSLTLQVKQITAISLLLLIMVGCFFWRHSIRPMPPNPIARPGQQFVYVCNIESSTISQPRLDWGDGLPQSSASQTRTSPSAPYSVIDLGTLGGPVSVASHINRNGQVVGRADTERFRAGRPIFHAFLWEKGRMQDLGQFAGADDSWATGINSRGETVGYVVPPTSSNADHYRAFVWTHGKARYLRPLSNCRYSMAAGINDAGVVVGNSTSAQMDRHNEEIAYACRWEKGGVKTLPALGGDYSNACCINDAGQIAGKADIKDGRNTRAVLWNRERATDLGPPQGSNSQALGVNVRGDVVGFVVTRYGAEGFLWRAGRLLDLGNLIDQDKGEVDRDAWRESIATDVNAREDVVGYANPPGSDHEVVAVIWRGGRVQDLNSLIPASEGWVLDGANGINDSGEIVGSGKHNGAEHAFLLRPVPKS